MLLCEVSLEGYDNEPGAGRDGRKICAKSWTFPGCHRTNVRETPADFWAFENRDTCIEYECKHPHSLFWCRLAGFCCHPYFYDSIGRPIDVPICTI